MIGFQHVKYVHLSSGLQWSYEDKRKRKSNCSPSEQMNSEVYINAAVHLLGKSKCYPDGVWGHFCNSASLSQENSLIL